MTRSRKFALLGLVAAFFVAAFPVWLLTLPLPEVRPPTVGQPDNAEAGAARTVQIPIAIVREGRALQRLLAGRRAGRALTRIGEGVALMPID